MIGESKWWFSWLVVDEGGVNVEVVGWDDGGRWVTELGSYPAG